MTALFLRKETWIMLALGFSAGLPILLVYSSLSTWLHEAGTNLRVIGWFSLVGLAYGFKFLWAPLIDRIPCPILSPRLGHRRGWLLASQLALCACLLAMGFLDPSSNDPDTPIRTSFIIGALLIAIASATQDIVIDAVRVELAEPAIQAWLAGVYVAGYRVGMIIAGAGALYLATLLGSETIAIEAIDGRLMPKWIWSSQHYLLSAWQTTYQIMALFMSVGILTTWLSNEPKYAAKRETTPTIDYLVMIGVFATSLTIFFVLYTTLMDVLTIGLKAQLVDAQDTDFRRAAVNLLTGTLRFIGALLPAILVGAVLGRLRAGPRLLLQQAFVEPFSDLAQRFGRATLLIILVIGTYRLTDVLMGVLANPFYLETGFTKSDIATVTKLFGLLITIFGGFVGGWLTKRYGIYQGMLMGGLLSAITNLAFSWLANLGPQLFGLYIAIGIDNLAGGMAATAFVAFLSALTNREFTATQYASLFALTAIFPKMIAAKSGEWAEQLGYEYFFVATALLGLPTLVFLFLLNRYRPALMGGRVSTIK